MKIANVSVNLKNLPSKDVLIAQANKSGKYKGTDAVKQIEAEIEASGLYPEPKANTQDEEETDKVPKKTRKRRRKKE